MHEHFRIISAVINLIIGTAVAYSIHQKYRSYRFPFLKHVMHHVLFINGGFFLLFAGKYFELNLMTSWSPEQISPLKDAAIIIAVLLLSGMICKLHSLKWSFRPGTKSSASLWFLTAGTAVTLASFPVRYFFLDGPAPVWLQTVYALGISSLLINEIVQQAGMIKYGKKKEENSALSRSMGWLLISRYGVMTLIFLSVAIVSGWIIPENIAPYAAFLILIYLNAVPLIWLERFFMPYATSMGNMINTGNTLETFFSENSISKREQEIIRLLLDGKSNKQVEETLFISYHTVKNHLYNIYQKLGIKNRYELVHMVTRHQQQK